jgi:hypothetical protein
MSLDRTRKRIECDSQRCTETTQWPISLAHAAGQAVSSARGWLFVRGQDEERHYCPHCRSQKVRLA